MPDRGAADGGLKFAACLALLALPWLASCGGEAEPPPPEIRPVRTVTIAGGASGETFSLVGSVQAQTEINQSFRIDGRMLDRLVNVGDTVRPGQTLAVLDAQNEQSALEAARAQLAAARAQLVEATNNNTRMTNLVAENAVSRARFDQAQALLKTAQSQVEAMQAQVTLAENRLSYTRLVADVAGVVTAVGAEPGEVVGAGRMVVQVAREGGRDAVFDLPARIKDSAPLNAPFTVVLTADPAITAAGVVREIAPRADPVTGTFRIRVRLANPPVAMRLGTTVTGSLKLTRAAGFDVPPSALVRSGGKTSVWIVDPKTQTVALRGIEIGASDAGRVTVVAGLAAGDIVVTAGAQVLRPGQKVQLPGTRS